MATPWVASLYADLFYYRAADPRVAAPPLEDEQTRAVLLPAPPRMEWDEPLRSQLNRDARLSVATLELDTGLMPIQPRPAWDEVDWQRWLGSQYQNQTQEADTGFLPFIPRPALDEVDWQQWRGSQYQNQSQEADFGLLPFIPTMVWDEFDWQKLAPAIPGWTDSRSPQTTTEEDLRSLPPAAPAAFDDGEGSRDFSEKRSWLESDVLLGVPLIPPLSWLDDTTSLFVYGSGSLAAFVPLDDFVNAPTGSGPFGSAPRGRSARFGFSITSFR